MSKRMIKAGPGLWLLLHKTALNMSNDTDLNFFDQLLLSYREILPCDICKVHYESLLRTYYTKIPIKYRDVYTALDVFKITVDIHNEVNDKLGKRILTYDEALKIYEPNPTDDMMISCGCGE